MTNFKKISSIIFIFCALQWCLPPVKSANTVAASNSKTDEKTRQVSGSILGSIYRKSRQSRCVTCHENKRYGEDRSRYYSNYAARSGDDRSSSWYYPSYDRYNDRGYRGGEYDRYAALGGRDPYASADRYAGADRYENADRYSGYRDDRYGARPTYDRYDTRTRDPYERPAAYDRGESRGYGYDNRDRERDRYYGSDRDSGYYYDRDRYYERPRYGTAGAAGSAAGYGGYDRDYYDRYYTRYDFRLYRPWDGSYRGQPGYESSEQGYYKGRDSHQDRRYLPEPNYNSPCGIRKPNCPYNRPNQEEGTRVTSGTIDSGHYNMGVSQTTYNTNSNRNENENDNSKGSGLPAGWSYMSEDDEPPIGGSNSDSYASTNNNSNKNNNSNSNNNRDRNSDKQSSGYSALLDRGSNLIAVEPIKSNGNPKDSMASSDLQKDASVNETPKQTS